MGKKDSCAACGIINNKSGAFIPWHAGNLMNGGTIPKAPEDLVGSEICISCWKNPNGSTLEARIRAHKTRITSSVQLKVNCSCCGLDKELNYTWRTGNSRIPEAPQDLEGSKICTDCWEAPDGDHMEQRVRNQKAKNPLPMPNVTGAVKVVLKEYISNPQEKKNSVIDYWSQPYPASGIKFR